MKNEFVRQLQAKLGLTTDGVFGPETEATVRQFQRDHGIVPDGIVGPKTWASLDAA
jgi:peptidoglycan hydrolase-like protein with peptidoglycan-binding domain